MHVQIERQSRSYPGRTANFPRSMPAAGTAAQSRRPAAVRKAARPRCGGAAPPRARKLQNLRHIELHAVRLRGVKHLLRILHVQRNRLFADHRLFAGQRLQHNRLVQVGRHAHVKQIDLFPAIRLVHACIQRQAPLLPRARGLSRPGRQARRPAPLRCAGSSYSGTFPFRLRQPTQFSPCISFTVQIRSPSNTPRCPPQPDRPRPDCLRLPA